MNKNIEHNVPIVTSFLSYLLDERAFSVYTGKCYGVDLRQYLIWITEEQNLTLDIPIETAAWQRYSQGGKDVAGHVGPETISEHLPRHNGKENCNSKKFLSMARTKWMYRNKSNDTDSNSQAKEAVTKSH